VLQKKSKITTLDVLVLLALLGGLTYIIYQVKVKLNYNWQWGIIPQYLFRYDAESGKWVSNYLIHGLLTTLRLSFWGTLLATLLGTLMGLLRVSKSLFHRMIARSYVELMRNLPPLVIIFIFYFFISDQIMPVIGIDDFLRSSSPGTQRLFEVLFSPPQFASAFIAALFTLAIFEGAYITEIVRAGIESVEKGQWEASHALGLSKYHNMRHIILPQAMQRLLPALAGQFISLIKDSAIVSDPGVILPGNPINGFHLSDDRNLDYDHRPLSGYDPDVFPRRRKTRNLYGQKPGVTQLSKKRSIGN
jgi:polar amino acid transport system permease protein